MPVSSARKPVKDIPRIHALGGVEFPVPYWHAPGCLLYLGDVRACLRELPARSVHCCVTSPPYWGLRKYLGDDHPDAGSEIGAEPSPDCLGWATGNRCGACFVCHLVDVFAEVRRVLRDDGTCWIVLGDTFNGGQLLMPSRVALALRTDGWFLAQKIVWYSPNKMPESVTTRCTKSYEEILLLAKSAEYYYDAVAIAEPAKSKPHPPGWRTTHEDRRDRSVKNIGSSEVNKRDVWVVSTSGYSGAHFATFSPELITPCILAGTSEHGCCAACGRPWERVVVRTGGTVNGLPESVDNLARDRSFEWSRNGKPGTGSTLDGQPARRETVGWRKLCGCRTDKVVPAVVLDPFVGSGTTCATAIQLGRAGVGIDLSEAYLRENAVPRIEAAISGGKVSRKGAETVAAPRGAPPAPRKLGGAT